MPVSKSHQNHLVVLEAAKVPNHDLFKPYPRVTAALHLAVTVDSAAPIAGFAHQIGRAIGNMPPAKRDKLLASVERRALIRSRDKTLHALLDKVKL